MLNLKIKYNKNNKKSFGFFEWIDTIFHYRVQKFINYIVIFTIISQSIFGFVLPAQAQTNFDNATDEVAGRPGAETADPGYIAPVITSDPTQTDTSPDPATIAREQTRLDQEARQRAGKETKGKAPSQLCTLGWDVAVVLSECAGLILLSIGGVLVGISGAFLNFAVDVTVLQMSKIVNDVGVITAGWKTFRDLANMFFIFILIYIAIITIVGASGGQTRKMLVQLIIVALLINFSMFFTKVVIDASNILAIQFYNSISKGPSSSNNGFSWVFMNASRLTTIYPPQGGVGLDLKDSSYQSNSYKGSNVILIGFFGLIFGAILSFCFLAIGILFVIRFVILLFLMMLSPIALLGTVVPGLGKAWSSWKEILIREAIFAPTIMAMLWIVATIVNNPGFIKAIGVDTQTAGTGFVNIISGPAKDSMAVGVNFGILIAMLIGGLIISKSFSGSAGGAVLGAAEKWSRRVAGGMTFGAAGYAGRQSVGRIASGLSNMGVLKTNRLGLAVQKSLKGVASSSFDVRAAPLVGAGLQGAGLGPAAEGGFVEGRQKFRALRDRAFQRDEESVKAQQKNNRSLEVEEDVETIRVGAGAVAGPLAIAAETARARIRQNMSKLSEEDLLKMGADWHKAIGNDLSSQEAIITALSPAQVKALRSKAGFSPNESESLIEIRERDLNRQLAIIGRGVADPGYDDAIRRLQRMSGEELEIVSDGMYARREFVENLSRKQSKSLSESKEISIVNKEMFRNTRRRSLETAMATGIVADSQRIIENMSGEEVSRLNWPTILADPRSHHVWDNIEPRQLTDAADNMRQSDIDSIRTAMRNRATHPGMAVGSKAPATSAFLDSETGRRLF